MARLPYVSDPSGVHTQGGAPGRAASGETAELEAVYAHLRALGRPPLNLYRVLANRPPALRAFLGMSQYIRGGSALPAQVRELAILATAYALGVRYEQVHHTEAARRAGVPEEKLAAFPAWQASAAFDAAERAAMVYAHEVAVSRGAGDATFDALRPHFSHGEIIDLALTVGWYHLVATLLVPLRVDLEA